MPSNGRDSALTRTGVRDPPGARSSSAIFEVHYERTHLFRQLFGPFGSLL